MRAHAGLPALAGRHLRRVSHRFPYESAADQIVSRKGKRCIGRMEQENGRVACFSMLDCAGCPVKAHCLAPGEWAAGGGGSTPATSGGPRDGSGEAGKQRPRLYGGCYRVEGKHAEQRTRQAVPRARPGGGPPTTPGRGHGDPPKLNRFAELLAPGVRWRVTGASPARLPCLQSVSGAPPRGSGG